MTPYQIELLMHFRCINAPFPRRDAPAYMGELEYFMREKLIQTPLNVDRPELTDRGNAYLDFLCRMPLPVANWALPGPWMPGMPTQEVA